MELPWLHRTESATVAVPSPLRALVLETSSTSIVTTKRHTQHSGSWLASTQSLTILIVRIIVVHGSPVDAFS